MHADRHRGHETPHCQNEGVTDLREIIDGAQRITVLTGAGVSTDAGIPDFRGPNGLWTKNPAAQRTYTLKHYATDGPLRAQAWADRGRHPVWTAEPTAAHRLIAELGPRLRAVLTQNIDGLHQKAGTPHVLELHGTIFRTICLTCGDRRPMSEALARVAAGETDPPCLVCGDGILKSDTISFGQNLDPAVLAQARTAATDCDLFLAVGSSLRVQPVAGLCRLAVAAGVPLVICNADDTPYDALATAVVQGPLSETLPLLLQPAHSR